MSILYRRIINFTSTNLCGCRLYTSVREGITAVISVKLTEAQFEGQTKAKLGNAHIRTLVDSIVNDQRCV